MSLTTPVSVSVSSVSRQREPSPFGINIGEQIGAHLEQEGVKPALLPDQKREWSYSGKNLCSWSDKLFGGIQVEVVGFTAGTPIQKGSMSYMRVYPAVDGNPFPSWISLRFASQVWDSKLADVHVLEARNGVVTDVTSRGIPPLRVDIEWDRQGEPPVPHSRQKGKDNTDFVFFRSDGKFVQVQVSVVTRAGRIWVCMQDVYNGQVVRTTKPIARKLGVTHQEVGGFAAFIAPLFPENAFPGSDYLKTFSGMGPKVVDHAMRRETTTRLSDCALPKWAPQTDKVLSQQMRANGWRTAQVMFFNLVVGHGLAVCEDGQPCFVHFSRIIDEQGRQLASQGELPVLHPMKQVAIKYREEGGRRQATAIRILS